MMSRVRSEERTRRRYLLTHESSVSLILVVCQDQLDRIHTRLVLAIEFIAWRTNKANRFSEPEIPTGLRSITCLDVLVVRRPRIGLPDKSARYRRDRRFEVEARRCEECWH